MMFLLDSNVFIEAKNRYYGFDIAPGFWAWLDLAHKSGLACSIEAVLNELIRGNDNLANWTRANKSFFRPVDMLTTKQFDPLTHWAYQQSYTPAALNRFTGNDADYLLVAYASAHKHTVVTHEGSNPQKRNRVLIPEACKAMNVQTMNTFEMLRTSKAVLDLRT